MTLTRLLVAIGLLVAVAAAAPDPSGQNTTQQDQNTNQQDQSQQKSKTSGEQSQLANDLDIRYARLTLAMSKLELQRVQQINRQVPGTFTRTSIAAFDQSVLINEEQLKMLTQQGGKRVPMFLITAEANAKAEQQHLQRVLAINQLNPGTITQIEIERARLRAELANVGLEKARSVNPKNEAQFLQWQMDQLREDLYQLRTWVAQLSRLN
jgi:hypothetical protein